MVVNNRCEDLGNTVTVGTKTVPLLIPDLATQFDSVLNTVISDAVVAGDRFVSSRTKFVRKLVPITTRDTVRKKKTANNGCPVCVISVVGTPMLSVARCRAPCAQNFSLTSIRISVRFGEVSGP